MCLVLERTAAVDQISWPLTDLYNCSAQNICPPRKWCVSHSFKNIRCEKLKHVLQIWCHNSFWRKLEEKQKWFLYPANWYSIFVYVTLKKIAVEKIFLITNNNRITIYWDQISWSNYLMIRSGKNNRKSSIFWTFLV